MKDISWKKALKHSFVENILISFAWATLIMAFMLFPVPALVDKARGSDSLAFALIIIIGIITFIIVFMFSIWETRYYLMYPEKRKKSNTRYRSYGNYVGFSDLGSDSGGYSDCGDDGGDGGC